jgi:hypothetical protein
MLMAYSAQAAYQSAAAFGPMAAASRVLTRPGVGSRANTMIVHDTVIYLLRCQMAVSSKQPPPEIYSTNSHSNIGSKSFRWFRYTQAADTDRTKGIDKTK